MTGEIRPRNACTCQGSELGTAKALVQWSLNGPAPGPSWAQQTSQSTLGGESDASASESAS